MTEKLLDTDTLSQVMRGQNARVASRVAEYLEQHDKLTFSLITRYEVLRGLKTKGAAKQLDAFERRCRSSHLLPITDDVIMQAADLYAYSRARGLPANDANLLIAATALSNDLPLVTSNTRHYAHIPGLRLECWTTR